MEDIDVTLAAVAQKVSRLGLSAPAIALLEMHKPLRGILEASTVVAAPALTLLFGARLSNSLLAVLESPERIEQLIQLIESQCSTSGERLP